jgi:MFS family permease
MNVSISAVVRDLDTTVSGVQSAIALEALVSAAFILIGSKIGDLFGRKRAYVLGLLGYAVGALAMTIAQGLTAIIIFWAIVIAIVLSGIELVRDVPYTGPRRVDPVGALLSVLGMGGVVLGILVWQEGGEAVGALLAIGVAGLVALVAWLRRPKRVGKPTLLDPDLFTSQYFRLGSQGRRCNRSRSAA